MTARAKRLERYLSETLGWQTIEDKPRDCPSCDSRAFHEGAFCQECGHPLPPKKDTRKEVLGELESAIAYALKESK